MGSGTDHSPWTCAERRPHRLAGLCLGQSEEASVSQWVWPEWPEPQSKALGRPGLGAGFMWTPFAPHCRPITALTTWRFLPPAARPRYHRAGGYAPRVGAGRTRQRAALMLLEAASLLTRATAEGAPSLPRPPSPLPYTAGRPRPVNEAAPSPCPEAFSRCPLPCHLPGLSPR